MFIYCEGHLCHPHVQMAKVPTKEDGMLPFIKVKMTFCSPQGDLGNVVFQQ